MRAFISRDRTHNSDIVPNVHVLRHIFMERKQKKNAPKIFNCKKGFEVGQFWHCACVCVRLLDQDVKITVIDCNRCEYRILINALTCYMHIRLLAHSLHSAGTVWLNWTEDSSSGEKESECYTTTHWINSGGKFVKWLTISCKEVNWL